MREPAAQTSQPDMLHDSGRKLRIALVDDHAVVREGYRWLLEQGQDMEVVVQFADAASVRAALPTLNALHLDVLILDLSLPGHGGTDLLRTIAARCPKLRILVFTMHDSPVLVNHCLRLGAAGFITKASSPEMLVDAVRRSVRGELPLSPDVAQALHVDPTDAPHLLLSPRAYLVLLGLIEGQTLDDIAGTLDLSSKTVSNYQAAIRRQLGVNNGIELLLYAQRHRIGSALIV